MQCLGSHHMAHTVPTTSQAHCRLPSACTRCLQGSKCHLKSPFHHIEHICPSHTLLLVKMEVVLVGAQAKVKKAWHRMRHCVSPRKVHTVTTTRWLTCTTCLQGSKCHLRSPCPHIVRTFASRSSMMR